MCVVSLEAINQLKYLSANYNTFYLILLRYFQTMESSIFRIWSIFIYLVALCHIRAEDCAISDAFEMGEVEEKDLDEVNFDLNC